MIDKYYTDIYTKKEVTEIKISGVVKTNIVETNDLLGKFDILSAPIEYENNGKKIKISCKLYVPIINTTKANDIIDFNSKEFNVIEVINPFNKNHHLEILLESRV